VAREDDFAARMEADTTLMAILTGKVWASGEVGLEGITRDAAPTAFDASGWLKPCALVRQRGNVPTFDVVDYDAQVTSARQIVEIWLYQDSGYAAIDAAMARLYTLFQGHIMAGTFEIRLANDVDRQRDTGALAGASLRRLDFQVDSIIQ
jgi:hypothetical protein